MAFGSSYGDLPSPPADGCRVLIVEDDGVTSRAMERLARQGGYTVAPAPGVAAALEELEAFRPHCVLLDLMLPDGSGAEVLRHIRRHHLPCRVALLTGVPDSPAAAEAKALAPDAFFSKPIDLNALMAWLAQRP